MNLKFGLKAFACSLLVLNPCDAARHLDKNLQNPRTVSDTSSMLQEMHGQMKLMQEQLGSLKASQQLLSAENAIKNLTPKVRKLEVHLERLEKQMAMSATTDDFASLKNDIYDLKSKLTAFINAPDTSADAAISALTPTLDRMQKQVMYLYESMKSQVQKNEIELQEKMEMVNNHFNNLELDLQTKLQELSGASSSLNLVRQSLQQNHSMMNALKLELEEVKNEKIGQVYAEIDQIKYQHKKEDLLNNVNVLKNQFQNLATVFNNSLNSVEASHQLSEKSIAIADETKAQMKELIAAHEKQKKGLVSVFKKEEGLKQELDLVKTLVEQNAFETNSKLEQLEVKMPFDKLIKLVNALKLGTNDALEQIAELKKNQDKEHGWTSDKIQEVVNQLQPTIDSTQKALTSLYEKSKVIEQAQGNAFENLKKKSQEIVQISNEKFKDLDQQIALINKLQPSVEKNSKALAFLYEKTKNVESKFLVQINDLKKQHEEESNSFNSRLVSLGAQIDSFNFMKTSIDKAAKGLSYLNQQSKNFASKNELDDLKTSISVQSQDKFNKLAQGMIEERNRRIDLEKSVEDCGLKINHLYKTTESLSELRYLTDAVTADRVKINSIEGELSAWQDKLKALGNYSLEIKSSVSKAQSDLKLVFDDQIKKLNNRTQFLYKFIKEHDSSSEINSLKEKVNELSQVVADKNLALNLESNAKLHAVVSNMDNEIKGLHQRLQEKDSMIEKLVRKVNFLTKSLQEKLEQNHASDNVDLSKIKQELSEKMDQELKMIQKERMVFETLIQRIAALEAAVSPDAQAARESN